MNNISKPSSTVTNIALPSTGETWANDSQTWDEDFTTWDGSGSLITNLDSPLHQFLLLETGGNILTEDYARIIIADSSLITNISKPI